MKKYKGFTLVELLAIITILGVMVILVVPQIGGSINAKKEKELEKIMDIIENAGKTYHSFNNDVLKISIDTLVNEKYLTNDLTNPVTNEKLDGCVRIYKDSSGIFNYKYTTCERVEVPVTIELKGGTSSQFSQEITQNTYDDSTKIELVDPTKQNSSFKKWQVVKGNSYINGKTLIVGDTETIVYAIWEDWPTLTLNLNEGSLDQSLSSRYASGTHITLKTPIREGYTFAGWSVNEGEGNSIVSGNNFTMGSIDTILTANWTKNTYTISYNLDGGTNAEGNPTSGEYGSTVTINNPTRTGYKFTGWTVAGALMSGTNLTIGTSNVSLTANWQSLSLIASYSCANTSGGTGPYNFTYTGNCTIINDGNNNWRVKFLTSGTFTPTISMNIDVFLVGGGGYGPSNGGGGGYTNTKRNILITANSSYNIVVGNGGVSSNVNGGSSSAFGYSADGGYANGNGGSGGSAASNGSAGNGGSDGENGRLGKGSDCGWNRSGGSGQGTTTREFGESTGELYSGGGGGSGCYYNPNQEQYGCYRGGGNAGSGGGGQGKWVGDVTRAATSGTPNTGGGGGGGGGSGGSGIVVIRNSRFSSCSNGSLNSAPYSFEYTGICEIVDDGSDNWRVRFLTDGIFTPKNDANIDVFLVGGGGYGPSNGGGGGYTNTKRDILITANSSYNIVVGNGGVSSNVNGGSSSAFGYSADGGYANGNGGSGGSAASNGSAGNGGSDGENGGLGRGSDCGWNRSGGSGQGTTTREFEESTGELYSGGGGGSGSYHNPDQEQYGCYRGGGNAGSGGGGQGQWVGEVTRAATSGTPNTGGGGGGGGGSGGSGIVVIRNARG